MSVKCTFEQETRARNGEAFANPAREKLEVERSVQRAHNGPHRLALVATPKQVNFSHYK